MAKEKGKKATEAKAVVAGQAGAAGGTAPVEQTKPAAPKLGRAEAIRASLNAIVEKALAPFKRPFACVGTQEGEFTSINGRKGKFAYIVQDSSEPPKTFKVGLTQMKEIGVEPPAKPKKEPVAKVAKGKKGKDAPAATDAGAGTAGSGVGGAVLPD